MNQPVYRKTHDGADTWRLNGLLHRHDGPAVVEEDGYQAWYCNGRLHRDGGPAVIYPSGVEAWYRYGERHRIDGPAIVRLDGIHSWYIYNVCIVSAEQFQATTGCTDEQMTMLVLKYGTICKT